MTPLLNNLTPSDDTELVGSRIGRIDPDSFRKQSGTSTDDDEPEAATEDGGQHDEPVD